MSKQQDPKKQKRNKIIKTVSILGLSAVAIVGVYAFAIEFLLKDYQNMSYITFFYDPENKDGGVTIRQVNPNSSYPSNFEIPKKLLGRNVTTIADGAFSNLPRLKSVSMPSTITTIGHQAFFNSANLENIKFSPNLVNVGSNAIEGTKYYESHKDGFMYLGKVVYKYKGSMPNNSILVPTGSEIEKQKQTENNTRPENEKYNIVSMDPNYSTFADGVFANKSTLIEAYLSDQLVNLPNEFFKDNANLTTVEYSSDALTIGNSVFENTPNLTNITINQKITSIGRSAFASSGLSGEINLGSELVEVADSAFENNPMLAKVVLPETVESIGTYAFAKNSSLSSINLPDTITSIGEYAFSYTDLTEVRLPTKIAVINNGVFEGAENLEKVTVADKFIGLEETIALEEGQPTQFVQTLSALTSIRENAFKGTKKLKTIAVRDENDVQLTSDGEVNLPGNATDEVNFPGEEFENLFSYGNGSNFQGSGIEVFRFPTGTTGELPASMFENALELKTVDFSNVKTTNLRSIKANAFRNTPSLTSISLPNTVNAMESAIFQGSGITDFTLPPEVLTILPNTFRNTKLTSFTFNDKLKTIDTMAFADNEGLTSITLPQTIEFIRNAPFTNTPNLSSINIPVDAKISNFTAAFKDSGITSFVIPNTVIELSASAFEGASKLTSVTFPDTLTKIGERAFYGATSLENVELPANLQSVGNQAFHNTLWYNNKSVGHLVLDRLYYGYKDASGGNTLPNSNYDLVIPEGVEVISDNVFKDNNQIKSITLPSSVRLIGQSAFEGLTNLETVTISNGSNLTSINKRAFANNPKLTSFILPDSVKTIAEEAFADNSSLTTFTVSVNSTLETIGLRAFNRNAALKEFYLPKTLKKVAGYAFALCTSLTFYYHPDINPANNRSVFENNWNPEGRQTNPRP